LFEMRRIEKRFDAVVALKGASLKVTPGEITALLGSNGSGKSTMVKVLAGLVKPNDGEILFDGKPVTIHSSQDSHRLGIATAFQDLSLAPTMSVIDNIVLGSEPHGKFGLIDRRKAVKEVRVLLERFNIDCDLNAYVTTLVPSTQSLIEVAKAIYLKPRLLLLDEVTASLHQNEVPVLFNILKELKNEGVAIVFVTHRINEVFELCDNVNIMRSGETVAEFSTKDITLGDIVYNMTGKRPDMDAHVAEHHEEVTGEPVLEVSNMEIFPKVKDISFKAYKGEIVGIAGLEGQGQPEFIRAILGDKPIEGGSIKFKGEEVNYKLPAKAVRKGIGFISGDRNNEAIFAVRSVGENIYAGKTTKGRLFKYISGKEIRRFSQSAIDKYNIKVGAIKDPASSLSGGNQQKLVVARWIAMNPDLLLLDDPTKGVDIHSRMEIHNILRECARESSMTIIYSSSENEELLAIADRIYIFYEGRVSGILSGGNKTLERLVAAQMGMTAAHKSSEKEEELA
jgi:ribose transport system ATP-binding protein